MKHLLFALLCALSLTSCSRHLRQAARPYLDPLNAVPTTAAVAWPAKPTTRPDSPAPAAPKRRLLGLLAPRHITSGAGIISQVPASYHKCKGCTFITAAGDVAVAGKKAQQAAGAGAAVTVAGKKAQAAKADSGAFIGQASARTQAAAGRDIAQTATTTKKNWLDYALPAVGIVGGAAALYWLIAGGGGALLWGLVRRKKSTDTPS